MSWSLESKNGVAEPSSVLMNKATYLLLTLKNRETVGKSVVHLTRRHNNLMTFSQQLCCWPLSCWSWMKWNIRAKLIFLSKTFDLKHELSVLFIKVSRYTFGRRRNGGCNGCKCTLCLFSKGARGCRVQNAFLCSLKGARCPLSWV